MKNRFIFAKNTHQWGEQAVLTSTHILCFEQKKKKKTEKKENNMHHVLLYKSWLYKESALHEDVILMI